MVYADLAELYGGELDDGTHFCGGYALMQFTGVKDKNGRDIYEGDIVHYKQPSIYSDGYDITLPVRWDEESTGFSPINGWHIIDNGNLDDNTIPNSRLEFEIIGNIHENPELLPHGQEGHICKLGCSNYSSRHSIDASGNCNMGCC